MNRTTIPAPPDPKTFASLVNWQMAVYAWMQKVKGQLEGDSAVNISPIGPFVVSSFTAVSTITGTDNVSNFVATLIAAMQKKGLTSPSLGTGNTQ